MCGFFARASLGIMCESVGDYSGDEYPGRPGLSTLRRGRMKNGGKSTVSAHKTLREYCAACHNQFHFRQVYVSV